MQWEVAFTMCIMYGFAHITIDNAPAIVGSYWSAITHTSVSNTVEVEIMAGLKY